MSMVEILEELPRLSPSERRALSRKLLEFEGGNPRPHSFAQAVEYVPDNQARLVHRFQLGG